jgi:hypothetical protein
VFQGPRLVDTTKLVRKPTPAAWHNELKETEVSVLPLVKDPARTYQPGWITYRSYVVDSPEVEIICGGLNEKDLKGAALWRQGHLLHFAFDLAPAEMNETGQALLLNSIAYIAGFTDDRPIARTPSGWAEKDDAPRGRRRAAALFASSIPADRDLDFIFNSATKAVVSKMDRLSYPKWHKENSPFLTCDKDGRLMVDSTAKELGIPLDQLDFFQQTIEKLSASASSSKARELLKRYAPPGPAEGSAEEWVKWWETNRPYVFFSEQGGYRWYLDPLAKRRGIPSAKLQGPARATAN